MTINTDVLTSTDVINQITNHTNNLGKEAVSTITSYSSNSTETHIASFTKDSTKIFTESESKINSQSTATKYTSSDVSIAEAVVSTASANIDNLKEITEFNFTSDLWSFTENVCADVWDAIVNFTQNLLNVTGQIISTIWNTVTALFNSIVATITALVNNIINTFKSVLNGLVNGVKKQLAGLIAMFNNAVASVSKVIEKSKTIVNNFFERDANQASTSKYIQANIPNEIGALIPNASVLAKTPDAKIITPQLKSDINKVKEFKENPLAALFNFVSSLIPSVSETKIAETPPTGAKSEYGKIVVKEMMGGSLKIQDGTPGNIRDIDLHPTGTYQSSLNDGSRESKVTGNKKDITDGNWNITTSKDKVEIVVGDSKIEIRKNELQTTKGNRDVSIDGTLKNVVQKDVTNDFKANYVGKIAKNYNESVGGNRTETTDGNLDETVANHKETVKGSLTIHVTGDVNIHATGGVMNLSSGTAVSISAPSISLG